MSESQWNTEPLKGSQVSIKQNALKVYKNEDKSNRYED